MLTAATSSLGRPLRGQIGRAAPTGACEPGRACQPEDRLLLPLSHTLASIFCVFRHDFHHSHNKGNYGGAFFHIWDRLMGTDADYVAWKAEQEAEKQN